MHLVLTGLPVVEVAENRNRFRIGRPDGEVDAVAVAETGRMGAQLVIKTSVRAFVEKIDVVFSQQASVLADVFGKGYVWKLRNVEWRALPPKHICVSNDYRRISYQPSAFEQTGCHPPIEKVAAAAELDSRGRVLRAES